jgi:hypothetical protein
VAPRRIDLDPFGLAGVLRELRRRNRCRRLLRQKEWRGQEQDDHPTDHAGKHIPAQVPGARRSGSPARTAVQVKPFSAAFSCPDGI